MVLPKDLPVEILQMILVYVIYSGDNVLTLKEKTFSIRNTKEYKSASQDYAMCLAIESGFYQNRYMECKSENLASSIQRLLFVNKRIYSLVPTILNMPIINMLINRELNCSVGPTSPQNSFRFPGSERSEINDSLVNFAVNCPSLSLFALPSRGSAPFNGTRRLELQMPGEFSAAAMNLILDNRMDQIMLALKCFSEENPTFDNPGERQNFRLLLSGIDDAEEEPLYTLQPHVVLGNLFSYQNHYGVDPSGELVEISREIIPENLRKLRSAISNETAAFLTICIYTRRDDLLPLFLDKGVFKPDLLAHHKREHSDQVFAPLYLAVCKKNFDLFKRVVAVSGHKLKPSYIASILLRALVNNYDHEKDYDFLRNLAETFLSVQLDDNKLGHGILSLLNAIDRKDIVLPLIQYYLNCEEDEYSDKVLPLLLETLKGMSTSVHTTSEDEDEYEDESESEPSEHRDGVIYSPVSKFAVEEMGLNTSVNDYMSYILPFYSALLQKGKCEEVVRFCDVYFPYIYHCFQLDIILKVLPVLPLHSLDVCLQNYFEFSYAKTYLSTSSTQKSVYCTALGDSQALESTLDERFYIHEFLKPGKRSFETTKSAEERLKFFSSYRESFRVSATNYNDKDTFDEISYGPYFFEESSSRLAVADEDSFENSYLGLFLQCENSMQLNVVTYYFGHIFSMNLKRFVYVLFFILYADDFFHKTSHEVEMPINKLRQRLYDNLACSDTLRARKTELFLSYYSDFIDHNYDKHILCQVCQAIEAGADLRIFLSHPKLSSPSLRPPILTSLCSSFSERSHDYDLHYSDIILAIIDYPGFEPEHFDEALEEHRAVITRHLVPIDVGRKEEDVEFVVFQERFYCKTPYELFTRYLEGYKGNSLFVKGMIHWRLFSVLKVILPNL